MAEVPEGRPTSNVDIVRVKGDEGALSLELVPLREGVARAFIRYSPRGLRFSETHAKQLSDELLSRPYSRILVQDSKKRVIRKSLGSIGWSIDRAIKTQPMRRCSAVTTYDLPIDEGLMDSDGRKPDVSNTSDMRGISVDLGDRKAWAFFTEDSDAARLISEKDRRQGLLVANSTEDMFEATECLVQYLAFTKKPWAVFSTDLGRFVRKYDPISWWRLTLDRVTPYQHTAQPLSSKNKGMALRLFSEYYDESLVQAMLRLKKYRNDKNYSIYLVDGGFVISRIEGDVGVIFDIYVTPANQGRGLGEELMRCGLTTLAGRVSSCYLNTSYPRAKEMYEKFGFKTAHTQLGIRLDELALTPPTTKSSM